jgi:type VI secretion system protein VasG
LRKRIEALEVTELDIIDRDETAGYDVTERRAAIEAQLKDEEARRTGHRDRARGRPRRPW